MTTDIFRIIDQGIVQELAVHSTCLELCIPTGDYEKNAQLLIDIQAVFKHDHNHLEVREDNRTPVRIHTGSLDIPLKDIPKRDIKSLENIEVDYEEKRGGDKSERQAVSPGALYIYFHELFIETHIRFVYVKKGVFLVHMHGETEFGKVFEITQNIPLQVTISSFDIKKKSKKEMLLLFKTYFDTGDFELQWKEENNDVYLNAIVP